jgi:hypothetical protein
MGRLFELRGLGRDERGSVLVIFAVAIPTFILVLALALDIGNWYVHQEKLRNRADAAAFAAGLEYAYRFPDCTEDASLQNQITYRAWQFGGDESSAPIAPDIAIPAEYQPAFNSDVNDQLNVTIGVNAAQSGGADHSDGGGPCVFHTPAQGDFITPDGGYWTDIKAREANVVSLFGGFGVPVPAIATSARLALRKIETASAVQPFAVADAADTPCAWARFVTPTGGTQDVQLFDADNDNTWIPSGGSAQVTMPDGGGGVSLSAGVVLGSCTTANQRTFFPDLGYVQAWTNSGTPRAETIGLSGNTCNGDYIFREGDPCAVRVDVTVVFAASCPQGNRRVWAYTGTFPGSQVELTRVTPPAFSNNWTGTLPAINPGSGLTDVGIAAQCTGAGGQQNLSQTPQREQRVMAGNDRQQGPIRNFTLGTTSVNNNGGGGPANGPTNFTEAITLILDPLHSDQGGDLRSIIRGATTVTGNPANGFLSGALTCGPNGPAPVADAVADGCTGPFAPGAARTVMPTGGSGSGALQAAYTAAWCAGPNNWGSYPSIPRGDPRLIIVGVSTPGAPFNQSSGGTGNSQATTRFAAFYVTGWMGQTASCTGNDPAPPAIAADAGALWGHFVKFVRPPSSGTPMSTGDPDEDLCRWNDPVTRNDVEACIATLVR